MARPAGQIRQRGPERWLVSVYLGRDATDRGLYQSRTVREGRRAAEKKLRELLHQKDAGRLVRPDRRPVGEYLEWRLANVGKARVRASTFASYEALVATYLKPELGAVRLDKLSTCQAQVLFRQLAERGLSPRTVRYALATLNGTLRKACKLRLLEWNPMDEVELPRQPRRELQVPGEAARARLLAELHGDGLWPLWCLMLTMGLRPGEALALRWADIDFPVRTPSQCSAPSGVLRAIGGS